MHRSGEYRGHTADIIQLLVLGDHLLSLGRDGKLLTWRIGEYDAPEVSFQHGNLQGRCWFFRSCFCPQPCTSGQLRSCTVNLIHLSAPVQLPHSATPSPFPCFVQYTLQLPSSFNPTCFCHPDTYLNKVVVGSEEGSLQLWNFSTGRRLFEFKGWGAGVRCLAPSPALDVVGVGLADG